MMCQSQDSMPQTHKFTVGLRNSKFQTWKKAGTWEDRCWEDRTSFGMMGNSGTTWSRLIILALGMEPRPLCCLPRGSPLHRTPAVTSK